jgi:hypothetical protein
MYPRPAGGQPSEQVVRERYNGHDRWQDPHELSRSKRHFWFCLRPIPHRDHPATGTSTMLMLSLIVQ